MTTTDPITRLPSPALPLLDAVQRVGVSASVQPSNRGGYGWKVVATSAQAAQAIAVDLLRVVEVPQLALDGVEVHVHLPACMRSLVTS